MNNSFGRNLLRYTIDSNKNPRKFITIDTETTSLNLFYTIPWQISFLVSEGKKIIKEYDLYPYFPHLHNLMSKDAARICNFSEEDYKSKGKPPLEVFDIVHSYLFDQEYGIVTQNGLSFDLYVLRNFYRECGKEHLFDYSNLIHRFYDTLALMKGYKCNWKPPQDRKEFTCYLYKCLSQKVKGLRLGLANIAKELDIKIDMNEQYHDGLFDVKMTWYAFLKILWLVEIE